MTRPDEFSLSDRQVVEILQRMGGLWPDRLDDEELNNEAFEPEDVRAALKRAADAVRLLMEPHAEDDLEEAASSRLSNSPPFEAYFSVADEIYEGLALPRRALDQSKPFDQQPNAPTDGKLYTTLADLDPDWVALARMFKDQWSTSESDLNGPPWPPYLPWAEEYSNDLRMKEARDARRR